MAKTRPEKVSPSRRRVVLTPTDIKLFRFLWILRVLTLDQLHRLGYYQPDTGALSSLDNVRKRLRRLWRAGYLRTDLLLENRQRLYFLADPALASLREHYGIEQRRLYRPKTRETLTHLRHALLVSECAVRMVESLRTTSAQLAELLPQGLPFYHPHTVGDPGKKKHVERFVSQEDVNVPGRPEALRIRPDLVFGLSLDGQRRLFFLEADRGSESPQQIAEKLEGYHYYRKAPVAHQPKRADQPEKLRWRQYGRFSDFRVLLVTTTHQRIEGLRHRLASTPGFELAAFTTADRLAEENAVIAPIWHTPDGATHALLKETRP